MFQGNLDSETKLQVAVVALQALDWRCKHLTQRLRSCLQALVLSVPRVSSTPEQTASQSSASPQPLNVGLPSVTNALSIRCRNSSPRVPLAVSSVSVRSASSGCRHTKLFAYHHFISANYPSLIHLLCFALPDSVQGRFHMRQHGSATSSSVPLEWCTHRHQFSSDFLFHLFAGVFIRSSIF
jgi:hypothetical protein